MKTLVIYYSLENHTKLVAQTIEKQYRCDIIEIRCKKAFPTSKIKKYLWGGKSVIMRDKPELSIQLPDFSSYDVICIGTPVWAGSFASPIRCLTDSLVNKHKNLIFFACHGGGGSEKCFTKMEELFVGNNVLKTISFQEPKDIVKLEQKIQEQLGEILEPK